MAAHGIDRHCSLSLAECLRGGRVGFTALGRYFLSFFKSDLQLSDYPVKIRQFDTSKEQQVLPADRFKLVAWTAMIFGWRLFGHGDTRDEALDMLRKLFDEYKANKPLPRPGTQKPIEWAPAEKIDSAGVLATDFAVRVLGFNENDVLFTDESSLWDFPAEEINDSYINKIRNVYGVDVSDLIEKGIIADILERIKAAGVSQGR